MKVMVVGGSEDIPQIISLILKVRWPELSFIHPSEAREGIELIHREQPDIVMLHFDSESVDCFDLISQIRSFSDVPLIVLSERNNVMDKVRALQMGADDWIAPSSTPIEFIAKVNAILRRCSPPSNSHVSSFLNGKLSINYGSHEVFLSGKPVKLTPIEYKILCHLVRNQGSIVSNTEVLHHVWGPNYGSDKEILKMSIYRLRSKIEEDPAQPKIILNERGVGYIIRSPDSTEQRAS